MILKVKDVDGSWLFHQVSNGVRVSRSFRYLAQPLPSEGCKGTSDDESVMDRWEDGDGCEIRADGVSIDRDAVHSKQSDGSYLYPCTGVIADKGDKMFSWIFNTEAYLLSDEGKTIERL